MQNFWKIIFTFDISSPNAQSFHITLIYVKDRKHEIWKQKEM